MNRHTTFSPRPAGTPPRRARAAPRRGGGWSVRPPAPPPLAPRAPLCRGPAPPGRPPPPVCPPAPRPGPPGDRGGPGLRAPGRAPPAERAAAAPWPPVPVRISRRSHRPDLAAITCLRYGLHTRTVRVILARSDAGVLALVTTDLASPAARLIERYAARWPIEMDFPQLAKGPGRPVGRGGEDVRDLD